MKSRKSRTSKRKRTFYWTCAECGEEMSAYSCCGSKARKAMQDYHEQQGHNYNNCDHKGVCPLRKGADHTYNWRDG